MKTQLALAALAFAASAHAQDLRLGDLNFFQKKGTIYWNTELERATGDSKFEVSGPGGTSDLDREFESLIWNNRVTWGWLDHLNVGATLNYAVQNEIDSSRTRVNGTPNTDPGTYDNKGLSDISLLANYRVLSDKLFVDLISSLTIGFQDRESGSGSNTTGGSEDGNYHQGHHSLFLGTGLGQKYSAFEWRAELGLDYHLAGENKVKVSDGSDINYDTDAYVDWIINLQGQYRWRSDFVLGAFLNYTIPGDQDFDGKVNNVRDESTLDTDTIMTFGVVGKYNFPDTTLAKISFSMTPDYSIEREQDFGFFGRNKLEEKDINYQRLMIGGEFLF